MPRVDKTVDDIIPEDYNITTMDLGPTTEEQEFEELEESISVVRERLRREKEKGSRLERENLAFKQYIQQLMNPIRQCEGTSTPPPMLSQESIVHLEGMRSQSPEVKSWIGRVKDKTDAFIEELVQKYENVAQLLERLQAVSTACSKFDDIRRDYMPYLQDLMNTPLSALIGVIEEGSSYNFSAWYFTMHIRGQILDKVKVDCVRVDSVLQRAHNKIIGVIDDMCDLSGEVEVHDVKNYIHSHYFDTSHFISGEQLDSIYSISFIGAKQVGVAEWEKTLDEHTQDVMMVEGTIQNTPSVPVEDMAKIVPKYAALVKKNKHKKEMPRGQST